MKPAGAVAERDTSPVNPLLPTLTALSKPQKPGLIGTIEGLTAIEKSVPEAGLEVPKTTAGPMASRVVIAETNRRQTTIPERGLLTVTIYHDIDRAIQRRI